jgi:hypothetical protein
MKTIEQLSFDNIVLVERYLTGKLTEEENTQFERRLKIDNELRFDFKMVVESYRDYGHVRSLRKRRINIDEFNFDQINLSQKRDIAKKILNFGLIGVIFALLMVVLSALLVAFIL